MMTDNSPWVLSLISSKKFASQGSVEKVVAFFRPIDRADLQSVHDIAISIPTSQHTSHSMAY
ncbi:hypothetical protein, partial [Salinivirga cyanobacteriivorans]